MKFTILTISDTRQLADDLSGSRIAALLPEPAERLIVIDDVSQIRAAYARVSADILIANGGTGIAQRDVTYEALAPYVATEIPGFGEFFRQLSFAEIGSHAMASRAFAFFDKKDQLVFCLPGAPNACQLAMNQLILPEMEHLIYERRK